MMRRYSAFEAGIDLAKHQFVINDPVHNFPVGAIRDEYIQAILLHQPAAVEILLHGETCAEQADPLQSLRLDGLGGCVGNVQERNGICSAALRQPFYAWCWCR